MNDFRGNKIEAGDTIAYAWRRGSSMGLKQLKVVAVNLHGVVGIDPSVRANARMTNIKVSENVVLLEKAQ